MVQTDITYDNNYNRRLVHLLREMDEKHWKCAGNSYKPTTIPDRLGSFHGEHPKVGGGSHFQQYIASGNSPCYPPAHFHTGMVTRKKTGGDFDIGKAGNDVISALAPVVATALPALLGLGEPATGGKLRRKRNKVVAEEKIAQIPHKRRGHLIKGSPEAMAWAQKMRMLRSKKKGGNTFQQQQNQMLKAQANAPVEGNPTAYGSYADAQKFGAGRKRKSKKTGGLSLPKISDIMEVAKPVAKELGKVALDKGVDFFKKKIEGGGSKKSSGGGGRAKRAEIVKKVMKEKGLKMIEASKYVKQHGMF